MYADTTHKPYSLSPEMACLWFTDTANRIFLVIHLTISIIFLIEVYFKYKNIMNIAEFTLPSIKWLEIDNADEPWAKSSVSWRSWIHFSESRNFITFIPSTSDTQGWTVYLILWYASTDSHKGMHFYGMHTFLNGIFLLHFNNCSLQFSKWICDILYTYYDILYIISYPNGVAIDRTNQHYVTATNKLILGG